MGELDQPVTFGELVRGQERVEREIARNAAVLATDLDRHEQHHVSADAFENVRQEVERMRSTVHQLMFAVIGLILTVTGTVIATLIVRGLHP